MSSRTNHMAGSQLPQWFMDHCVKTAADLVNIEPAIQIHDADAAGASRKYQIDSSVYGQLANLVRHASENSPTEREFSHGAVTLKLSNWDAGGLDFLKQVVLKFAKDIAADLVMVDHNDMEDLAEHFLPKGGRPRGLDDDHVQSVDIYFNQRVRQASTNVMVSRYVENPDFYLIAGLHPQGCVFPRFPAMVWGASTILGAPGLFWQPPPNPFLPGYRGEEPVECSQLVEQFTLAILRKKEQLGRRRYVDAKGPNAPSELTIIALQGILSITNFGRRYAILQQLQRALRNGHMLRKRVLILATDNWMNLPCSCGTNALPEVIQLLTRRMAPGLLTDVIFLAPHITPQYGRLSGDARNEDILLTNTRSIQRRIRRLMPRSPSPLLQPYVSWSFIKGIRATAELESTILKPGTATMIALRISDDTTEANIVESLEQYSDRIDAIHAVERPNEARGLEDRHGIANTIVSPTEMPEGWSSIALELNTKSRAVQLVRLLKPPKPDDPRLTSRLLRCRPPGGVLLYGPPGTGKTHLARIIAKESSATLFQVSGADLQSKWQWQPEQEIQYLFRLARARSPSIIYLKEADAVLRYRAGNAPTQTTQIANQLLLEISRSTTGSPTPVLVILATARPQDLDHAFLRHVSIRLCLDLPTDLGREQIFRMVLSGDRIAEDVDMGILAEATRGYTGADIVHVCEQAALVSWTEYEERNNQGQGQGQSSSTRTPTNIFEIAARHLFDAIHQNSPTVTPESITEMSRFAARFDMPNFDHIFMGRLTKRTTAEVRFPMFQLRPPPPPQESSSSSSSGATPIPFGDTAPPPRPLRGGWPLMNPGELNLSPFSYTNRGGMG